MNLAGLPKGFTTHWIGTDCNTPEGHIVASGTDALGNRVDLLFRSEDGNPDVQIGRGELTEGERATVEDRMPDPYKVLREIDDAIEMRESTLAYIGHPARSPDNLP